MHLNNGKKKKLILTHTVYFLSNFKLPFESILHISYPKFHDDPLSWNQPATKKKMKADRVTGMFSSDQCLVLVLTKWDLQATFKNLKPFHCLQRILILFFPQLVENLGLHRFFINGKTFLWRRKLVQVMSKNQIVVIMAAPSVLRMSVHPPTHQCLSSAWNLDHPTQFASLCFTCCYAPRHI